MLLIFAYEWVIFSFNFNQIFASPPRRRRRHRRSWNHRHHLSIPVVLIISIINGSSHLMSIRLTFGCLRNDIVLLSQLLLPSNSCWLVFAGIFFILIELLNEICKFLFHLTVPYEKFFSGVECLLVLSLHLFILKYWVLSLNYLVTWTHICHKNVVYGCFHK